MDLDHALSELLRSNETITSLQKAGEGNMNLVMRVKTNQRNFVLKQSKPYVVKYPFIPAPLDRIKTEHFFYKSIEKNTFLQERSPKILDFVPEKHLLLMEDLGEIKDYTKLYKETFIDEAILVELLAYLNELHQIDGKDFPNNMAMRKLNHEHIFQIPYTRKNGIDLDQIQHGLQELAKSIQQNQKLKDKARELGKRYLQNTSTMIHGDFYPGSWLQGENGLKIIDPEFAFAGEPEFDLGIMASHLKLGGVAIDIYDLIKEKYLRPVNMKSIKQWEGIEIIRRLIGVAQIPLQKSIEEKESLLNYATHQILRP